MDLSGIMALTEQQAEVIAAARDIVTLWKNPRIRNLSRANRNAAIETARNNLIETVNNLEGIKHESR